MGGGGSEEESEPDMSFCLRDFQQFPISMEIATERTDRAAIRGTNPVVGEVEGWVLTLAWIGDRKFARREFAVAAKLYKSALTLSTDRCPFASKVAKEDGEMSALKRQQKVRGRMGSAIYLYVAFGRDLGVRQKRGSDAGLKQ